MAAAPANDYEAQRQARIEANRRKMAEMGLLEASRSLSAAATAASAAPALEHGAEPAPRLKRRRVQQVQEPASLEPTRLSRRLRGETALAQEAAAAAALAEVEAEGRARRVASRKRLALEPGQQLAAPFTLWSIGVTVWELGAVLRGAWAQRYWSSPACLYHHAYPVGYRATKVVFGRTYEMRIEEGPSGPLFKVIDQQSGAVFAGGSPTKPWTDVCVAHRTGQRISGPLFFGFSDPLTQRAIAANLYSAEELAAALQGEAVAPAVAELSPEEAAAKEFMGVEGIGEATAILLARTQALGGRRHAGLASLRAWASASDANAQALLAYLTSSQEVPESTRRWPAWGGRLAPRIVRALSGRWLGPGASPAAGEAGDAAAAAAAEADASGLAAGATEHQEDRQREQQQQQQQQQRERQQQVRQPEQQQPPQREQQNVRAQCEPVTAKENQQPARPSKPAATAAAAAAAAGRSRRERRPNSHLAEYLIIEEDDA